MNNIPFTHTTTKKKPNNGQTHLTCCKWKRNYMIDKSIVWSTEKLGNAQKRAVRFFVQASYPCGPMGSLRATIVSGPHQPEMPWKEIPQILAGHCPLNHCPPCLFPHRLLPARIVWFRFQPDGSYLGQQGIRYSTGAPGYGNIHWGKCRLLGLRNWKELP